MNSNNKIIIAYQFWDSIDATKSIAECFKTNVVLEHIDTHYEDYSYENKCSDTEILSSIKLEIKDYKLNLEPGSYIVKETYGKEGYAYITLNPTYFEENYIHLKGHMFCKKEDYEMFTSKKIIQWTGNIQELMDAFNLEVKIIPKKKDSDLYTIMIQDIEIHHGDYVTMEDGEFKILLKGEN